MASWNRSSVMYWHTSAHISHCEGTSKKVRGWRSWPWGVRRYWVAFYPLLLMGYPSTHVQSFTLIISFLHFSTLIVQSIRASVLLLVPWCCVGLHPATVCQPASGDTWWRPLVPYTVVLAHCMPLKYILLYTLVAQVHTAYGPVKLNMLSHRPNTPFTGADPGILIRGEGVTFAEHAGVLGGWRRSGWNSSLVPLHPNQSKYLREMSTLKTQVTMLHVKCIYAKYTR